MRLTVRAFGLDLLDVELTTDPGCEEVDDDYSRDLSGGTTYANGSPSRGRNTRPRLVMTISTHENAPPLDGWQLPPRCCGAWCVGSACEVCGRHKRDIPASVVLGEN